ncbi:hypothetical protein ACFOWE_18270 [Planomonospora corallina]|uniref:Uncharacterized protein n=1 Tax=Planomonospora corallina TaxID=1806052 RepID=A0ABV8I7T2_9ACTN
MSESQTDSEKGLHPASSVRKILIVFIAVLSAAGIIAAIIYFTSSPHGVTADEGKSNKGVTVTYDENGVPTYEVPIEGVGGETAESTEAEEGQSEEESPAFTRKADGGTFASAQDLVSTIESLGVPCHNPNYSAPSGDGQIVQCSTGSTKVEFGVANPGDSDFVNRIKSNSAASSLNALILAGQNWILSTSCDYDYGNRVRAAIGGEYFNTRFVKPTNCPAP